MDCSCSWFKTLQKATKKLMSIMYRELLFVKFGCAEKIGVTLVFSYILLKRARLFVNFACVGGYSFPNPVITMNSWSGFLIKVPRLCCARDL